MSPVHLIIRKESKTSPYDFPWADARIAFDAYQVKNNIDRNGYSLDQIQKESLSTRNAEYYGWSQIYKNSNTMTEFQHLKNTIKSTIKRIF